MWCRYCQQDVPAVATVASGLTADGPLQCARCQRTLTDSPAAQQQKATNTLRVDNVDAETLESQSAPSVVVEPWRVADVMTEDDDQRLRHIGRSLRSAQSQANAQRTVSPTFRIDRPDGISTPMVSSAPDAADAPVVREPSARPLRDVTRPGQASAWIAALTGAVVLGAGVGLLGWSLLDGRAELWNWGVAGTLTGQGLIIVGLVQLLANLWTNSRDTTHRIVALHYELRRLQRTADSIAGMRSASPGSFYADLSRGASPQVLMANLKGQVEELQTRLAHR